MPSWYFFRMLVKPAETIERVLAERPGFISLAVFITFISLLRGTLDGVLTLLTEGQLFGLLSAERLLSWFIFKAYPLLLADWLAGYVRWLGFALVPYVLGRLCGGTGKMGDFLRLYGIILGIYVVTALLNFVYFFMPLPMFQFNVAPQFNPTLGVGQFVTSIWLAWITYLVLRRLHGLPPFESAMIGFLTPALNIAALVLPGIALSALSQGKVFEKMMAHTALISFSVISLGILILFVATAVWIIRHERSTPHSDTEEPIL